MIEESIERFVQEIRQLQMKKGPYYDKWLKNYTASVTGHCVKIAKHYNRPRWLRGMERWLYYEKSIRSKGG